MRKIFIGANWKMHMNVAQASIFMHRLDKHVKDAKSVEVVIFPSFVALQPLSKDINHHKFKLGAQNVHYSDEGTFTGEISPPMLKGLALYVIVGHSERRNYFGENDDMVARKIAAVVRNGMSPILCVGDGMADYQNGESSQVVLDQLNTGLRMITAGEVKDIVVMYEPVWAISKGDGHGNFAKPDKVQAMTKTIREAIQHLYGKEAAEIVRVIYGGSVNPDNVSAYLGIKGIDGLLVGGASLNYEQFAAIIKRAQNIKP